MFVQYRGFLLLERPFSCRGSFITLLSILCSLRYLRYRQRLWELDFFFGPSYRFIVRGIISHLDLEPYLLRGVSFIIVELVWQLSVAF